MLHRWIVLVNFGRIPTGRAVLSRFFYLNGQKRAPFPSLSHLTFGLKTRKSYLLFTVLLLFTAIGKAQNDFFIVKQINLCGNNKTKAQIILRELDFEIGDSIAFLDSASIAKINSNKIFNTNLFIQVSLAFQSIDSVHYQATINVKERWYIFPIPIVELADRNVNEWWNQRNHDLKRIEWGLRFRHDNFLGRNQKLKIVLQGGFTKKYEIFHDIPYINEAKTLGLKYGISYSTNKSIGYIQQDNKLLFYDSEEVLRRRFYSGFSFNYRKQFYTLHEAGINFHHNSINEEVLAQSNFYLGTHLTLQRYFRLHYIFNHNKTDINYYPLKGHHFKTSIYQHGLGLLGKLSLTEIKSDLSQYWNIKPKLNLANRLTAKVSSPSIQPYNLQYGFGYGEDFVRGFEPYIVDGQNYYLSRNELKYRILSFTTKMGKFMPLEEFETVPYAIYLKLIADVGYVSNKDPRLESAYANTITSGYGIGIDIVTYYDAVLRFEYAINNYGKTGFYFHMEKGI